MTSSQQGSGFVDDLGRLAIPFALIAAKEGVDMIHKSITKKKAAKTNKKDHKIS